MFDLDFIKMDVTVYSYPSGDPVLIDKIVNEFLSQGKFDKLRKECMADADTKPAYQNLQQRVESTVSHFLKNQVWKPDLNKNQLRDSLRKHILESGFLDAGINRVVDQIVNTNVLATVFMPEVEEVVYRYLSIPRPGDRYPKQTDYSNKILGNTNSKQSEDIKLTSLESYKDQKLQKMEETSSVSDDLKTDISEISSAKTPETWLSIESVADMSVENEEKEIENEIKQEEDSIVTDQYGNFGVREEEKSCAIAEGKSNSSSKIITDNMELLSDESPESLSKMGAERLQISESDGMNAPDSDSSLPLEINEKSMSGSGDSDDFIINKMSPISQGRLTPEEVTSTVEEGKKPQTTVGQIPKMKSSDSESSKSSKKEEKGERLLVKGVYSSDESDSSKQSLGKSDSEDKKLKDEKLKVEEPRDKGERKYKENDEKKRKSDHHGTHGKYRKSRDEKLRSSKEEKDKSHSRSKDEKSREKDRSSHSRSKSSSHHKSTHRHDKEHHRDDSKSKDKDRSRHDKRERDKKDADRKKREDEKRKKSKNVDDHGKERYKKDDRRSTDRDSNERDRAKDSNSSRIQSDGKKKKKEKKVDGTKKEMDQKEESGEKDNGMKEASETTLLKPKNEEVVHEGTTCEPPVALEKAVVADVASTSKEVNTECLDVTALLKEGALTVVTFPKIPDDYYAKFGSKGFRYFEEWEKKKMECEQVFKEFIDKAGDNLSLLSDEGSDYEGYEGNFNPKVLSEVRRQEIVSNSTLGFTNFSNGLIFDPVTYEFYKWTNNKFYEKYGKKNQQPAEEEEKKSPSNLEIMDESENAEKNEEHPGGGKNARKGQKRSRRCQKKKTLKTKIGREQHRFVKRCKKPHWVGDINSFRLQQLAMQNIERSEDSNESVVVIQDSNDEENPVLLSESPNEEVMRESQDVGNRGELSGDAPIDDLTREDEKNEESPSGECKIDESSNRSSTSAPKTDVEANTQLHQIQASRRNKKDSSPQTTSTLASASSESKADIDNEEASGSINNPDSEISPISIKVKKGKIRMRLPKASLKRDADSGGQNIDVHKKYDLPLSPESDDFASNKMGAATQKKSSRKRTGDDHSVPVSADVPAKKLRKKRIMIQKYDSQDLYKPRPFSIGSKSRGRALGAEESTSSKMETKDK